MHILVCGGAGYIGSHMAKMLVMQGHEVTVFDNLSTGHMELAQWGRLHRGDLTHSGDIDGVFSEHRFDAVMHFSARSIVPESVVRPDFYYLNNVVGAVHLLNAMVKHGVKQLIFSSTAATYGMPQYTPIDEAHPTQPINPYGASKLMVENLLGDYERAFGLRSVALRYFNAAGADPDAETGEWHDPETHLIPNVLLSVKHGSGYELKVFGNDYPTPDGTCVRDYIHVVDLCSAHLRALDYLQGGGTSTVFNLGNDQGFSVLDVIHACETVTGVTIPYRVEPRRAGDPPILVATCERARRELGWKPSFPTLENIIASAWRWHQKH